MRKTVAHEKLACAVPSGNDKGVRALLLQIHCWMEKGSDQNCGEPATTGSVDNFCWEQPHDETTPEHHASGRHDHDSTGHRPTQLSLVNAIFTRLCIWQIVVCD